MTEDRYLPGSCVVCGTGTDTGLAFEGEAEWHVAGIQMLGVGGAEAAVMVSEMTGNPLGMVPDGRFTMTVRVCAACVDRAAAPFPAPVLLTQGAGLPVVSQNSSSH